MVTGNLYWISRKSNKFQILTFINYFLNLRKLRLIFLSVLFLINCGNDETIPVSLPLTNISNENIQSENIENGDIIFRKGKGFFSPFLSNLDNENGFTHLGVIKKKGNLIYVIHSDVDEDIKKSGVRIENLDDFKNDSFLFEIKKNKMIKKNKILFIRIIDEFLEKKVQFDDKFDLDDDGARVYCSELLWVAAKRAKSDFPEPTYFLGKPYISITDIYRSNWFK